MIRLTIRKGGTGTSNSLTAAMKSTLSLQSQCIGSFEAHTDLCVNLTYNAATSFKLGCEYGFNPVVADI